MKKGYTLIELIVVLSIIIIFSSIAIPKIGKVKDTIDNIELKYLANEVKSLLSYGKAYCRKNKVPGKILVDVDGKSIVFSVTNSPFSITKTINLKDNMNIGSNFNYSDNTRSDANNITDEGFIITAGTITLRNIKGKEFKITISVGNDIIRSYEGDNEEGDIIRWEKEEKQKEAL